MVKDSVVKKYMKVGLILALGTGIVSFLVYNYYFPSNAHNFAIAFSYAGVAYGLTMYYGIGMGK